MTSPFDLSGKVALVTGGNSGIGLGMADALAAHGAAVAIWGTNEAKNDAAVAQVARHGRPVVAFRCDVGDQSQVQAAFAATVGALGRVDACFANAGVAGAAPSFLEMTAEEWHRVLRVNLDGAFYTCQEAVRHMVERGGGGSIVVTTSGASVQGQPRGQHYGASKAGVVAMMKGIAVEHARHGIRANAVLDRHADDRTGAGVVEVPGTGAHPDPGAAVGGRQRLRRHRRVPGQRRVRLPHRGHVRDRRRLPDLLTTIF